MHEAEAAEVLRWLTQEDPYIRQHQVASIRLAGTGRWFLDSPQFEQWVADEQQTLFSPGTPGSGKTTITSMVVDTLCDMFQADFTVGIAFFYCNFQREDQGPEELLRSLLRQLGCRLPSIPTTLLGLYQQHAARSTRPSVAELFEVLASIVAAMSKVYIVIDALDELSSSHRRELLSGLFALQSTSKVNLFVTSRFLPDIVSRFEGVPSLEISATDSDSGLIQYIDQSIRRLPAFVQRNPELQDQIKKSVLKASNGMFLLAGLQIQELASKRTPKALEAAIASVPETLHDFYTQKMRRIEGLPKEERHLAKKALAWLSFAERPLKAAELLHALGVEEGSSEFDVKKVPETREIVALCEGFVTYGETDGILRLLHASVLEYLRITLHEWDPNARATVATGCITYLAFNAFCEGFCKTDEEFESRLRNFPLYRYAARYWGKHLRDISPLPGNEIRSFLMDQAKVASASQAMLVSEDISLQQGYSQRVTKQMTGLHLAAYFGLKPVIKLLLAEGQKPTSKDSEGRTPLWHATEGNDEEAMRLLSPLDRTTFTMMLAGGEKPLAGSLLQSAGQSIKDSRLRTALHIGVLHSDTDIMERALRCGVDINSKDGDGNTPLQVALQERKTQAIDWLLNKSAEAAGITVDDWLQGYGKQKSDIVKLSGEKSGPKEVTFLALEQFATEIALHPDERKRLFCSSWPISASLDPQRCSQERWMHSKRSPVEEQMYRHSIIASVPISHDSKKDKLFKWSETEMRIAWTMKTLPDSSGKDSWISQDHFSTLPAGSIPDSGAEFVETLIHFVMRKWLEFCDCIDSHLIHCVSLTRTKPNNKFYLVYVATNISQRPDVLNANGRDPDLIVRLLEDANTWISLRRLLHNQVEELRAFRVDYGRYGYKDQALDGLAQITEDFARVVDLRIDKLDKSSSALIQLEFNLTSIREAQKSTTLNRSIKRLTWITFIFLPLTFISSLFGMNVDVLKVDPPWWWYVVFAAVTLGLTMTVWIIFKRYRNLEDKMENSFAWLVGSQESHDVERGLLMNEKKKIN